MTEPPPRWKFPARLVHDSDDPEVAKQAAWNAQKKANYDGMAARDEAKRAQRRAKRETAELQKALMLGCSVEPDMDGS